MVALSAPSAKSLILRSETSLFTLLITALLCDYCYAAGHYSNRSMRQIFWRYASESMNNVTKDGNPESLEMGRHIVKAENFVIPKKLSLGESCLLKHLL